VVKATEQGEKKRGESICGVLKHPMRVRILEILNEGPKSPSQFVEEGLVPKQHYEGYHQALSLASYHFRELEKEGLLEIIETIPRRGALEHVYRGLARVYFTDAEFERLSNDERRQFSRISFQGLIARADSAMQADTFDSRADRHLTWMPARLDEQGWAEMTTAMAACFGEVERIRHDAEDRLAGSGGAVVTATFGMVAFESPAAPPPPETDLEGSRRDGNVGADRR
jgi:DNA-binding transcriptional ArsR family regulator